MSFTINLYATVKRENSTYIPSGSGVTRNVVLKEATSLLNPVFVLDFGNANPTQYNYLYCASFLRYYYIRDWIYDGRLWEAHCESDPLASFKQQILNTACYVLRSASASDPKIIDDCYPAKAGLNYLSADTSMILPTGMIGGGTFCVGISGYPTTGGVQYGCGVKYYLCNAGQISNVVQKMFTGIPSDWDDLNGKFILDTAVKALLSPLQFVTSCTWLPFPSNAGSSETIYFGWWNSGVVAPLMDDHIVTYSLSVNVPKPPNNRGDWQRLPPFAQYSIYIPYFGLFPLPPEKVFDAPSLTVYIQADWITGMATLKLFRSDNGDFVLMSSANIGVPVAISGKNFDFQGVFEGFSQSVGSVNDMRGGVASALISTATGNVNGLVNGARQVQSSRIGVASGLINSATSAMRPILQTMGTNGGNSNVGTVVRIFCEYFEPTEEDNQHFGRPLCQKRQLSGLSGYCQVADGYSPQTRATPAEKDMIKAYLEGGFYIE